jgi:hypothetical protein
MANNKRKEAVPSEIHTMLWFRAAKWGPLHRAEGYGFAIDFLVILDEVFSH